MTQSNRSAPKTPPEKITPGSWWLLIFIFRLLLLFVGGGIALIAGIVLGMLYPRSNPGKPLIQNVLESVDPKPPTLSPNSEPRAVPTSGNPSSELTPIQRQKAQAKLNQLQSQLRSMNQAVTTLESQIGTNHPNEPLEARMQAIALQLEGVSPTSEKAQSLANEGEDTAIPVSQSLFTADNLKVTLPSDLLFEQDNSILRPEANLILDKIVTDLRSYPSSTIRIAAYTDTQNQGEEANRELSFRRAKAVEQYLVSALGEGYRWIVVGYGGTRPLVANETEARQQRNRRVEIAVEQM